MGILAHIKPTGKNFKGKPIKDFFERPERLGYKNDSKIRSVNYDLNEIELKVVKDHFLRLIHPLNSFLVPKHPISNYNKGNIEAIKPIGEQEELILYVEDYIKNKFKNIYDEFNLLTESQELVLPKDLITKIQWGLSKEVKKEKKVVINKDYDKVKLGSYVKSVFTYFFENNMLSKDEIDNLLNPNYSKKVFGISSNNLGIIRHVKDGTKIITKSGKEHNRYWIDVFDNQYHVYSQWYNKEKQWLNFKKWEEKIKNNE